jgi:thiol-disulfide isomerase/thioredoxin
MTSTTNVPGTLELCKDCVTVLLFTQSWCGHCKKAKPEFHTLESRYHDQDLHVKDISGDDPLIKAFKIAGFPTILMYSPKHNSYVKYSGPREAEPMHTFALKMSKSSSMADYDLWEYFPSITDQF